MKVTEARKIVEEKFDEDGMCCTCGWFGSIEEYDLSMDMEINEEKGFIRLPCVNREAEDTYLHRGVQISID